MKYVLFAYPHDADRAGGGLDDVVGQYDTLEEAQAEGAQHNDRWTEVEIAECSERGLRLDSVWSIDWQGEWAQYERVGQGGTKAT